MIRKSISADFSTGSDKIQHAPARYLETVLGKEADEIIYDEPPVKIDCGTLSEEIRR